MRLLTANCALERYGRFRSEPGTTSTLAAAARRTLAPLVARGGHARRRGGRHRPSLDERAARRKHWGRMAAREWERESSPAGADHCRPWLVRLDGVPVLLEIYRPAATCSAKLRGGPADLGCTSPSVSVSLGQARHPGAARRGPRLFAADPDCGRGSAIRGRPHRRPQAFAAAGFSLQSEIDLPHKRRVMA